MCGITEASATRKPRIPRTRRSGIDDSEVVDADFAGPDTMSEARGSESGKLSKLIRRSVRPGYDFGIAHIVKGALMSRAHARLRRLARWPLRSFVGSRGSCRQLLQRPWKLPLAKRTEPLLVGWTRAGAMVNESGGGVPKRAAASGETTGSWWRTRANIHVCITGRAARKVDFCLHSVAVSGSIRHLAFVFEYDAGQEHMILQVFADSGQVLDDVDSKFTECVRIADSGEH